MITYKKLKELLHYDPETGVFQRKVATSNVKIGDIAGTKTSKGYIRIMIDGKSYMAHRLAWFYYHGYMPEHGIDHIDRDPSNNRIENLREVGRQCNMRNTGNHKSNTSGVKGVVWFKQTNKWRAQIKVNRKPKHLGLYEDFADAVCARHTAEVCLNWHGCDSSSPAYKWVKENISK